MRRLFYTLFALYALSACATTKLQPPPSETDTATASAEQTQPLESAKPDNSWWQAGQQSLQQRLRVQPNTGQAKNIILFVGDGMGISTITAARIFDGQSKGASGEENILSFEQFPYVGLVKTYNTDAQVADSAGTASALNTGVKTRIGAINTWAEETRKSCFGPTKSFPRSLAERAELIGMSTGVVTTTRITHATPAAVYAHSPDRNWESNDAIPEFARNAGCIDIADQLIQFDKGDGIDVVLGGGRRHFLPTQLGGKRTDNRNLIEQWQQRSIGGDYVESAQQFRALDAYSDTPVLGLFTESHMSYETDRNVSKEPSISEMTSFAIDKLSANEKGYYLMVEGGRIDHAHHANNAYRALSDAQAFANAIQTALGKVDLNETLIIVTADHSHVFTMAGYPVRGNPILGLVRGLDRTSGEPSKDFSQAADGKPYTTLGYHNGANLRTLNSAPIKENQALRKDYQQQSAVSLGSETHAGEDVAVYAIGPQSHLVGGVMEQNLIFHIMSYALGWR